MVTWRQLPVWRVRPLDDSEGRGGVCREIKETGGQGRESRRSEGEEERFDPRWAHWECGHGSERPRVRNLAAL